MKNYPAVISAIILACALASCGGGTGKGRITRIKGTIYNQQNAVIASYVNSFRYDAEGHLSQVLLNDTVRVTYHYYGDSIVEDNGTPATNSYVVDKNGYLLRDRHAVTRADSYEYDSAGYAKRWINSMFTTQGMPLMSVTVNHTWENGNMVASASEQAGLMNASYDYYTDRPYQQLSPSFYKQGRNTKNLVKGANSTFRGMTNGKVYKYEFDKQGRVSRYTINQTDDTRTVYELTYEGS